jgi:hypothetical protein
MGNRVLDPYTGNLIEEVLTDETLTEQWRAFVRDAIYEERKFGQTFATFDKGSPDQMPFIIAVLNELVNEGYTVVTTLKTFTVSGWTNE